MTFTFTMDAFPGYTYFNPTRKVLMAIQTVEDATAGISHISSVFPHTDDEVIQESKHDPEKGGDSVNEDNIPLPPISATILTMPAQDTTILGKTVSEMISEDTYVCENGTVHGTLKYINNFLAFNTTKVEEQSGYYFPVHLSATSGEKMTLIKNGVVTKRNINYDQELVLRLTTPNTLWEIMVDDEIVAKLNFRTAIFAK